MSGRADELSPREHQQRWGAWAASIGLGGVAVFTWPFLRTPRLGIGPSYAHLLGAWAAIVVALALLSRSLGRGVRTRGDRA